MSRKFSHMAKVDSNGRISLLTCNKTKSKICSSGAMFEFGFDKDSIVLRKYTPECIRCGKKDSLIFFGDEHGKGQDKEFNQYICKNCLLQLKPFLK